MVSDTSLDGKRILVTGASAGVGRATALHFASEGASVAVAARREERLKELVDEMESKYGTDAVAIPTDVSESEQVDAMVESTVDAFGGLDVVVSNAGRLVSSQVAEVTDDEYRTMMGVNVDGMFFTARSSLPHLKASEGALVFVGSYSATVPFPRNPLYGASKWWLSGFAISLQGAVGMDNVGVTVVNPAEVRTEIGKDLRGEPNEERYGPNEVLEPDEVAAAIGFAAKQGSPTSITRLDMMRRSKLQNMTKRSSFPD